MTKQAENSLDLFKSQSVSTIKQALKFQKKSVVDELMEHCGVSNIDDLAVALSIR